jgi:hypothetical protein
MQDRKNSAQCYHENPPDRGAKATVIVIFRTHALHVSIIEEITEIIWG